MNFNIYLISDKTNGLLEIHYDEKIANSALETFISEGQEINESEGIEEKASDFFVLEEIEVNSIEDLQKVYAEYGDSTGQFRLSILNDALEKGHISEQEWIEAKD